MTITIQHQEPLPTGEYPVKLVEITTVHGKYGEQLRFKFRGSQGRIRRAQSYRLRFAVRKPQQQVCQVGKRAAGAFPAGRGTAQPAEPDRQLRPRCSDCQVNCRRARGEHCSGDSACPPRACDAAPAETD